MSYGYGYDCDEGRALCGAITSIMTGQAYARVARMAAAMGPFPGYRDARCERRGEAGREGQRCADARSDRTASLCGARKSSQRTSSATSKKKPRESGTAR